MQIFIQGTSTHAVSINPTTTVEEIRKRICNLEQVAYEVRIEILEICDFIGMS
jgi:hypothetical protein